MTRSAVPGWSRPRQAVVLVLTGVTARTCGPVAAVVGSLLTAVNQGAVLLAGHLGAATLARVAANYVIPYCVASYGALSAVRQPDPAGPPSRPEPDEDHRWQPTA